MVRAELHGGGFDDGHGALSIRSSSRRAPIAGRYFSTGHFSPLTPRCPDCAAVAALSRHSAYRTFSCRFACSDAVETFERGGGRTALFESLLALGLTAA